MPGICEPTSEGRYRRSVTIVRKRCSLEVSLALDSFSEPDPWVRIDDLDLGLKAPRDAVPAGRRNKPATMAGEAHPGNLSPPRIVTRGQSMQA